MTDKFELLKIVYIILFSQKASEISKVQPEKRGVNRAKSRKHKKVLTNPKLDGKLIEKVSQTLQFGTLEGFFEIAVQRYQRPRPPLPTPGRKSISKKLLKAVI